MNILSSMFKGIGTFVAKQIFERIKIDGIKNAMLYKTKYRNDEIRLSVAYLIRIKRRDKYLLVKNTKILEQFQPVGGVYKYNREGLDFLRSLKFRNDDGYTANDGNRNDLRIRIKGNEILKFARWFKKRQGREITAYREFKEELLDTGILEEGNFEENDVDLRYERTNIGDMKFSQHFDCNEILIRDIYEFRPNSIQEKEIEKLLDGSEKYRFFSYNEIKRLGKISGEKEYRVGEHTITILEGEI